MMMISIILSNLLTEIRSLIGLYIRVRGNKFTQTTIHRYHHLGGSRSRLSRSCCSLFDISLLNIENGQPICSVVERLKDVLPFQRDPLCSASCSQFRSDIQTGFYSNHFTMKSSSWSLIGFSSSTVYMRGTK